MFLIIRQVIVPKNEEELKGYNCALGEIMRYVLYNDTRIRSNITYTGLEYRYLAKEIYKKKDSVSALYMYNHILYKSKNATNLHGQKIINLKPTHS